MNEALCRGLCCRESPCHRGTQCVWGHAINKRIHSLQLKCRDRSYTTCHGNSVGTQELCFSMSSFTSKLISTLLTLFTSGKVEWPYFTQHQESSRNSRQTQAGEVRQACVHGRKWASSWGGADRPADSLSLRKNSACRPSRSWGVDIQGWTTERNDFSKAPPYEHSLCPRHFSKEF